MGGGDGLALREILKYKTVESVTLVDLDPSMTGLWKAFPPLAESTTDDVRNIGALLFSNYNLPFQIIGVLVLVATVGVVLLSKRESR